MTWTKATWWSDDQYHKQDLRSTREDPRYQSKSKHEDRNQAGCKIVKKRAHKGDRTLDWTLAYSHRMLRSRGSTTEGISSDRRLATNRPNVGLQCPIDYRKVPERRNCDRTRPVACDRTLAASDQLIMALTVGMTRRVRSGRDQRPVSSRKAGFPPQRLLFQWGL